MNLVIDIGNSLVKAAFVEGDTVMNMSTFQSADDVDVDKLLSAGSLPDRCIVASTGADTSVVAERLRSRGVKVLEMTAQTPVPIGNDYLTPQTLGVDRLAAAVGAAALFGGDCLIFDFGTAITVDLLQGGVFKGGNISPGVLTRFRALHDYTSRLPQCAATDKVEALGRTTCEAIEQGVMQGITYEIEGYIASLVGGNVKLSIIFTGGDAKYFVKRIKNAIFADCELVVCGLNRILEYNAEIE